MFFLRHRRGCSPPNSIYSDPWGLSLRSQQSVTTWITSTWRKRSLTQMLSGETIQTTIRSSAADAVSEPICPTTELASANETPSERNGQKNSELRCLTPNPARILRFVVWYMPKRKTQVKGWAHRLSSGFLWWSHGTGLCRPPLHGLLIALHL